MSVDWQGDKALHDLEKELQKNMEQAADYLAQKTQEAIATPYPPASSPGNPPHLRSGDLQRSVHPVLMPNSFKVVADMPYALMLEFGTSKMAARPFLRPTFEKEKDTVTKIMTEGS